MATERELNILIKAKDMASKVLGQYEEQFSKIGKTLLGVGAAGVTGLGAAVKVAADFEQGMSKVGALSKATEEDMEKLTRTAKELGASTSFSATQAAEGMSFLAMAGFSVNETLDAMPGLLATAAAGQLDLGRTADLVSNILSGFGIAASDTARVADVLAATFTSSNTDLSMLGETMKYVAPVAAAAGLSLEEMAAATGLMGNAGIQGSMAGTSLRGTIMRLASPTDNAAAAMEQLGIQVRNADGSMKSLPEIIGEFERGLAGVNQETQDHALKTIIGMNAIAGFQALLNEGSEVLGNYTEDLRNAGGTAEEIASRQLDNLSGALTIMKSGLEGAAIAIGSQFTPYLRQAAEFVTGLLSQFNALDESTQRKIAMFIAAGSAVALVSGAILVLIPMIPTLMAAFSALLGPVGLVIAAVVALAYAFATNMGGIRDKIFSWVGPVVNALSNMGETFNQVRGITDQAVAGIVEIISWAFPYIQNIIDFVMSEIVPFVMEMWQKISDFINEILPPLAEAIQRIWEDWIEPIISGVMDRLGKIIQVAWSFIKNVISAALDIIMGVINTVLGVLTGDWSRAWDGIKQILSGVWGALKTIVTDGLNLIWTIIKNVLGQIKDTFLQTVGLWMGIGGDLIVGLVQGIKNKAGSLVSAAVDAVKGAIDAAKSFLGIKSPSRLMMEIGAFTGEGWIQGLQDQAKNAIKASEQLAAASVSPFESAQVSPGVTRGSNAGSGSVGESGSGSATVIFNFHEGSIDLPGVKNGPEFVKSLQGFALAQAFKSQ